WRASSAGEDGRGSVVLSAARAFSARNRSSAVGLQRQRMSACKSAFKPSIRMSVKYAQVNAITASDPSRFQGMAVFFTTIIQRVHPVSTIGSPIISRPHQPIDLWHNGSAISPPPTIKTKPYQRSERRILRLAHHHTTKRRASKAEEPRLYKNPIK